MLAGVLRGERVLLRAVERADVEVLAGFDRDPATWRLVSDRPYVPTTVARALEQYDAGERFRVQDDHVPFVVDVDGTAVGYANLWGIDTFNRRGHLGIGLAPEARGKGYGTDAVRVLLRYAFEDRGLHRVQLEALADNVQGRAAYRRAGFVEEGTTRQDAWVDGRFVDQVVMGVLAEEWRAAQPGPE
jgi:RimJ/RimL family protein N-acetyltransferase